MSSPPNPSAPGAAPPRLQLVGITKRYPAVVANSGVSLTVLPGEIHAVLGENGAGKSTLMKIIYGSVKPDEGSVFFNGQAVQVRNPQEARALGIAMAFQHFSLFDTLTLAEVTGRITAKAPEYGLDIDPLRPVHTLSVGEMQRVEIIRALLTNPKVLILDEPTSVLTPQAVEKLFVVLRKLAREGCSILYISHKLHEIRALCTACTVLRGGKVTGVCNPAEESNASLSRLMIGAEPPGLAHNLLLTRTNSVSGSGWIKVGALQKHAVDIIARFNVKAGGPNAAAKSLSGGNLQKFIVGGGSAANPQLLIVSQPTWGVDVGAAAQIRGSILALRDAGCAVLVVSEELDELFEICDRLHVVAKGHLSPSVPRAEATVERIGEWMSGLWHADVQAHLAQQAKAAEVQHA